MFYYIPDPTQLLVTEHFNKSKENIFTELYKIACPFCGEFRTFLHRDYVWGGCDYHTYGNTVS